MKKKLLTLALSLILAVSVSAGAVVANAAIKENSVAGNMLTNAGIVNELDWELKGETASTSFSQNVKGDIFTQNGGVAWGAGWLQPWDSFAFGEGNIIMSMDVLEFTGDGSIRPLLGTAINSSIGTFWFNNPTSAIMDGSPTTGYDFKWHRTEDLGVDDVTTAWGKVGWYVPWGNGYNRHVEFIFKVDGTMGVKSYALAKDGTYNAAAPTDQMWLSNAFPGLDTTTKYYFGLNYWNGPAGNIKIDNFKIVNTAVETPLVDCGFTGAWSEEAGEPTPGKLYNRGGKGAYVAELVANPANTDRMVAWQKVTVDTNVAKAATLTGTVDFRSLGKKFGFVTGLDNQEDALYTAGTSYVYFTQEEGVTYVNVNNGTAEEQKISLEGDYVAGEFYEFVLEAYTNNKATFTIGEKTVEFDLANIDGYWAVVTDGEGTAEVAFGGETYLTSYSYRGSKGTAVANNFNTGYLNAANWGLNSVKAVMFADPAEAKGIVAENGKLHFEGTADGSFFGTAEDYADYVLEFIYEERHPEDKPALKSDWIHGYSPLAVDIAVADGSGWGASTMVFLKNGNIQMQNYKNGLSVVKDSVVDYNFSPANAGEVKKTAVKFVVANNTITVYYQEVVDGVAPTTAAYIKGAEFSVVDTYGKITFATTESGVFAIDDVRVTPIDDPNPETVAANAAAHVDFSEIADEYRPYTLEAPVVTMTENVITWEAVEGATGYVVNVNGTTYDVGEALTYTVDISNPGDYAVTVYAKGNGTYISDSAQSEAIEFTVQAQEPEQPEQPENPDQPEQPTTGACNGSASAASVIAIAMLAAGAIVAKKRED
ncbi:MAG: hypothetical protein IJV67_01520 [Clostridia bacterium]|nr:hypothetical protein [Clostridia bacterium]